MSVTVLAHDSGDVAGTSWMSRARCRGQDPEQFFVRSAAQSRKAVRLCEGCTVRDECLQYAIANDIDFGIWGGLTERQRRRHVRSEGQRR